MSHGKTRREEIDSRSRLTLSRFAGVMVGAALLLGVPAAIAGIDSAFIWLDVAVCLALASIFFLLGLKAEQSHPSRRPAVQLQRSSPHRWRDTALVLSAVITIFSPAIKFAVELGGAALGRPVAKERECKGTGSGKSRRF
jgi:hypothetical protein